MFEECLTTIKKESSEATGKEEGNDQKYDDPKGEGLAGLGGLGDMFKDFERVSKDQQNKAPTTEKDGTNKPNEEDPFAKMFAGMGEPGKDGEAPFDED